MINEYDDYLDESFYNDYDEDYNDDPIFDDEFDDDWDYFNFLNCFNRSFYN